MASDQTKPSSDRIATAGGLCVSDPDSVRPGIGDRPDFAVTHPKRSAECHQPELPYFNRWMPLYETLRPR